MKQKALRAGDAHSHEDEECRKRSTLRFGRCLTSATGAQQRTRRENVPCTSKNNPEYEVDKSKTYFRRIVTWNL